uniref:Uncharacterized protein n=1 Tax=Anguilla anguilla TaxID=7936 RepID=A0A0E9XDJ5_ANGAN
MELLTAERLLQQSVQFDSCES